MRIAILAFFLPSLALAAEPRELRTWEDASTLLKARSSELQIALDDVLRAEAQSRVALASALPALNFGAAATYNLITNSGSQLCTVDGKPTLCPIEVPIRTFADGSLSASMPLLNVRTWHAVGTANRAVDAAKFAAEDVTRTMTLAVANAIVAVFTAERVAELNQIGEQNAETRLGMAKQRVSLGSGVLLDVVRAEQDLAAAKATVVTSKESLRQSREALGLALGVAGPISIAKTFNLDAVQQSAMRACTKVANPSERADVQALKVREEVATRVERETKLAFLPTINLTSDLGTTTRDTGVAPSSTWNVRGIFSWNIWDGGARYGLMRDAAAQTDQAHQRTLAQERRVSIEATQAERSVSVATEARKIAENARTLAEKVDNLTRMAFAEGRGTSLELVAAATALRQAEVTLALREFELVRAKLAAMMALTRCTLQ